MGREPNPSGGEFKSKRLSAQASRFQPPTLFLMESLSKQVLEANEQHKNALDQYTRRLRAELDTMNKLIVRLIFFCPPQVSNIITGRCRKLIRG